MSKKEILMDEKDYRQMMEPSGDDSIAMAETYHIDQITEAVCIIADKVYASCQQRECFPQVCIRIPDVGCDFKLVKITFQAGTIVPNSVIITPIPARPNFSRVRLSIRIPYTATVKNTKTGATFPVNGILPEIRKDVVLYLPESRDEFNFNIVVETRSEVLNEPVLGDGNLTVSIGTFIVIKVVGRVQLFIPEFGFCPAPPECEEFEEIAEDVCKKFIEEAPFPPDFFPPQLDC